MTVYSLIACCTVVVAVVGRILWNMQRKDELHGRWRFAWALLGVAGLTIVLWSFDSLLRPINLLLCYVPVVLIVAIRFGRGAAVLASVASFLAYNFFFVSPRYTLLIAQQQDVIELGIFLIVSLLAGTLAARERTLRLAAAHRAEQMAALYHLSQAVSGAAEVATMLPNIAEAALQVLHAGGIEIVLAATNEQPAATIRAGVMTDLNRMTVPVIIGGQPLGELRVSGLWYLPMAGDETATLLATITNQVALVVERSRAAAAALQAHALRDADRLKSALLSSVSHDLRTPLAVIAGAASNLMDPEVQWDPATRHVFAETITTEADRLNRFVRNLLEMSRLEADARPRPRSWLALHEVVAAALQRVAPVVAEHQIVLRISGDLPDVSMDATQLELVLSNLLENAAKWSPPGTAITIQGQQCDAELLVSVLDQGPGIPPTALEHIFEKFYRLAAPEQGPGGSGLGLAICQGIIHAHGGRIWAANRPTGGAAFYFTLPLAEGNDNHRPVD